MLKLQNEREEVVASSETFMSFLGAEFFQLPMRLKSQKLWLVPKHVSCAPQPLSCNESEYTITQGFLSNKGFPPVKTRTRRADSGT